MEIKRSAFGKGDGKAREWGWSGVESCTRRGSKRLRRGRGEGGKETRGEISSWRRRRRRRPLGDVMIGSRFRSRAFAGLDSVSAGWPAMRSSLHRAITLPRDPELRRGGEREATSGSLLKSIGGSRRDQRVWRLEFSTVWKKWWLVLE